MRWQIAEFIFCDQQQTLTFKDNTQQLEPMMVELLSYFCLNTDKIISKDQLIEHVWLGRIVSDNAISKLITKLRKAFSDDVRQPKFIATFPKKGYKFIGSATPLIELDESVETQLIEKIENYQTELYVDQVSKEIAKRGDTSSSNHFNNKSTLQYIVVATFFLLVIMTFFIFQKKEGGVSTILTHAKAITSSVGNERFPSVSPDGTRVSYMTVRDGQIQLMIKNIDDQRVIEIKHEENVGIGPANWSADGNLLVYLVSTPERCQYFIRSIEGLEVGEAKLIHNCPAGSYGRIAFTHDKNRLIYTESEGGDSAYVLFEINLLTGKKIRLTQPEIYLGGNSQFDMHPMENKLLISSPDKQQWEGFYSLDLETDELQLLFKQDEYTCCGIWSHDGKRVVLMGEYPAYQLISYDLMGKDPKTIYSGSRRINYPTRHSNGRDYLFTSGQQNTNIHSFDFISKKQRTIAETSFDDRLATFSNQGESSTRNIAYISLATGNEEVWLTDTEISQRIKLTSFKDSRHYVDLKWSPDGKLLMALTFNEIHIIDSQTGLFQRLKISQQEIRAASFKGNNLIAYSMKVDQQWRVHLYDIDNNIVTTIDDKWQYIRYTLADENTIWVDQKNNVYWGKDKEQVHDQVLLKQNILNGRVLNLRKNNHQWFWLDYEGGGSLMIYSSLSGKEHRLVKTNVANFDVNNSQILFSEFIRINSDIYQTQSLDK
ncbi:MAG: winged helix-turn-helix domain-containing protein [Colwellia sp.]|nr:winged helix-turn-helix domain-containing protein [Colwellia sp.]